jgi:uncharacterized repeat protein (TIGR01451 family)
VAAPITADADSVSGIDGGTGQANVLDVIAGDTLNGAQVLIGQVNLTVTTPATPLSAGAPVPTLNTATGQVSVPANTPAGTYNIAYRICERLNPTNCATNIATITVAPSIDLRVTKSDGVSQIFSGSSVTYTVVVTNLGPDAVTGARVTDQVGARVTCPGTNTVIISGSGVPAGSYTIANLTGTGIGLGTLNSGQSTTLTYVCQIN